MRLTRHASDGSPRWAVDGEWLAEAFSLSLVAQASDPAALVKACKTGKPASGRLLAPIDPHQELWAAGVTYLTSRSARAEESDIGARLYEHVYEADRPELFWKATGERLAGTEDPIRVRRDSSWNVPEPELVLFVNTRGEVIGYTAGNDVSSRSIEGENALYLPQAKVYDGSSAIGTGIRLCEASPLESLEIALTITRDGTVLFDDKASTSRMKRTPDELVSWLTRELTFARGVLLMTGTCLVPDESLTLQVGDEVTIRVGEETIKNTVA